MAVGHIEKRGANSYRLTVSGGSDPITGKRIKHQKTIKAKTNREAEKELALYVAQIEEGCFSTDVCHAMTFSEFSKLYLENYVQGNLSGTTASEYRRILAVHLLPRFGSRSMASIRPLDALSLYHEMEQDASRKRPIESSIGAFQL